MGNNSYQRQCDWAIEYRVCGCGPCRGSLEIYCHFNLIGHGPFISNVDISEGHNIIFFQKIFYIISKKSKIHEKNLIELGNLSMLWNVYVLPCSALYYLMVDQVVDNIGYICLCILGDIIKKTIDQTVSVKLQL